MNPYKGLGQNAFWATGVAKHNMFDIGGLWDPKFAIDKADRVATFGSCFAQHIGKALAANGYNWCNTEMAPDGLSAANAAKFNYGVFTARTGNIYTVSLLRQWTEWASRTKKAPEEVWEKDGRFYDPFRPNIEPDGFASHREMLTSRAVAVESFRTALTTCDVFVFTLGLTESWFHASEGHEYPMCPGTVAGEFDASQHRFVNQDYGFIREALVETVHMMRLLNPSLRFLFTVSPVPLTATMSGRHVLVATMESKSILRAVAGSVARELEFADYFPSYEIINATPFRGTFFEANQRNVNHAGVAHVMSQFFACLNAKFPVVDERDESSAVSSRGEDKPLERRPRLSREERKLARRQRRAEGGGKNEVCEEELLEAFAK